jgi:hypothetical protein
MPRKTRSQRATQVTAPTVLQRSEALLAIVRLRRRVELANRAIAQQLAVARRNGATWVDVADVLGVSRQAAQKRFEGNRSAAEGGSSDA